MRIVDVDGDGFVVRGLTRPEMESAIKRRFDALDAQAAQAGDAVAKPKAAHVDTGWFFTVSLCRGHIGMSRGHGPFATEMTRYDGAWTTEEWAADEQEAASKYVTPTVPPEVLAVRPGFRLVQVGGKGIVIEVYNRETHEWCRVDHLRDTSNLLQDILTEFVEVERQLRSFTKSGEGLLDPTYTPAKPRRTNGSKWRCTKTGEVYTGHIYTLFIREVLIAPGISRFAAALIDQSNFVALPIFLSHDSTWEMELDDAEWSRICGGHPEYFTPIGESNA